MADIKPKASHAPRREFPTKRLVLLIIILIPGVWGYIKLRELSKVVRSASCANDLMQLSLFLKMHAEARSDRLPPISATRGNIMMDPTGFYPEFMKSSAWVQCEYSDARRHTDQPDETDLGPDAFNDDSFFYLPWELRNEAEGLAFIEAYRTMDLNNRDKDLNTTVDGNFRALPITRVRSESPVPVLVEWSTPRHTRRSVLYSDGSVRSMNLGQGFPMTEAFLKGMETIADLDGSISRRRMRSKDCFLSPKID